MLDILKSQIDLKIIELQKFALLKWNINVEVSVSYDLNKTKALGTYYGSRKLIQLNKDLLLEFGELYIKEVVVHEFCHAVVHNLYPFGVYQGRKVTAHGIHFKDICGWYGISGRATTDLFRNSEVLKTKKKKSNRRKFLHSCGCTEHSVGIVRHNKISSGASYTCRKCKGKLAAHGVEVKK